MNPQYFMNDANYEEIEDFLIGASERDRDSWEQTRLLSFIVSRIGGCDEDDIKSFMPFTWDDENNDDNNDNDEEELNKLRELSKKIKLKDGND